MKLMSTPELRKKWRNHFEGCDRIQKKRKKDMERYQKMCARIIAEWRKNPILYPKVKLPVYPPAPKLAESPRFPEEHRGLT